jgi:hypothetical protein
MHGAKVAWCGVRRRFCGVLQQLRAWLRGTAAASVDNGTKSNVSNLLTEDGSKICAAQVEQVEPKIKFYISVNL